MVAKKPAADKASAAKKPAADKASAAKKPAADKASVAKKPAANKASVAKKPAANKASASEEPAKAAEEPLAGRLAPWTIGFLANYYRQRQPSDLSAEAPTRLAWIMRRPCTSTAVQSAEPVPLRGTPPARPHTEEPSAGLFPLFRTLVVSANRSAACRAHAVHNA